MIMTAGREGEEQISKTSATNKIDKAGVSDIKSKQTEININKKNKNNNNNNVNHHSKHVFNDDSRSKNALTKIKTAEYTPSAKPQKYRNVYTNFGNRSSPFKGFVNAMDDV